MMLWFQGDPGRDGESGRPGNDGPLGIQVNPESCKKRWTKNRSVIRILHPERNLARVKYLCCFREIGALEDLMETKESAVMM